jgi:hypothetical protein
MDSEFTAFDPLPGQMERAESGDLFARPSVLATEFAGAQVGLHRCREQRQCRCLPPPTNKEIVSQADLNNQLVANRVQ